MEVVHTIAAVRRAVSKAKGEGKRVGYMITLGHLHDAHSLMVSILGEHADFLVVSNMAIVYDTRALPDQPNYTTNADAKLVGDAGGHLLFAPSHNEIFPHGHARNTEVVVPGMGCVLCGATRPNVYKGVATTVLRFFNIIQPDVAIFGEKDFQQFAVVRRMVRDLHLPIEMLSVPTVRLPSGLAYASRNNALTPAELECAPALYRAMDHVREGILAGRDIAELVAEGTDHIRVSGLRPDYLEVRNEETLEASGVAPLRVFGSAYLGAVRLVDTLAVR